MRPDEGPVGQAEDEQKIGFSKSPHPPLTWSPLSQLGEGFWISVARTLVCGFLVVSTCRKRCVIFSFSFGEKVAVRPDEGIRFELRIMVCF